MKSISMFFLFIISVISCKQGKNIVVEGFFYKDIPYRIHSKRQSINFIDTSDNFRSINNSESSITYKFDRGRNGSVSFLLGKDTIVFNSSLKEVPLSLVYKGNSKEYRSGDTIKKLDFIKGRGWLCQTYNFDVAIKAVINEVTISISSEGKVNKYVSEGVSLNNEQIKAINSIKENLFVVIEARVSINKHEYVELNPVVFYVMN